MTFTFTLSTTRGQVRLLIPDMVDEGHTYEDEEIDAFLALEADVRRAAALALETIASNQAMLLKVIKIGDLSTDGAKLCDALRARAKDLREQALDAEAAEDGGGFEVVEMVQNQFGWRERMYNEALRTP